jgi:hypothetical protein
MINFYQWISEQATAIKPVPPSPRQTQKTQQNTQAPWINVNISNIEPEKITDAYGVKLSRFLEPCKKDIKNPECQKQFTQVNQYYKTTQNQDEKNKIKKYVNYINQQHTEKKEFNRALDVSNFSTWVKEKAQSCYDKKPECQKNIQTLKNGFNDPKQGKQGKEIIQKYLEPILKSQQRIQAIQNNEKNTQKALKGGTDNNQQQQPTTNTQKQPNWIEVQKSLGDAAASKNINHIQKVIQQFPNMPPEIMNYAQNLTRIINNQR